MCILLADMRQLVREKPPTFHGRRLIFAGAKHNIAPDGVCPRPHCLRRSGRFAIGMHAHLAEVEPEPWLEKGALGLRQRLPAAPQTIDLRLRLRRHFVRLSVVSFSLEWFFLLLVHRFQLELIFALRTLPLET